MQLNSIIKKIFLIDFSHWSDELPGEWISDPDPEKKTLTPISRDSRDCENGSRERRKGAITLSSPKYKFFYRDRPIECHLIDPREFVIQRLRSVLQSTWGNEAMTLVTFVSSIFSCSIFDRFLIFPSL